ncbi:MAG: ATP-binding protein [Lachnospiraceae bacterium]|nr:ATP-binding protein [Lachnospiraceae bacterium]
MKDTVHIHDRERQRLDLTRDFRVYYKTFAEWLKPYLDAVDSRVRYEELVRRVMTAAEEAGYKGNVWQAVITESLLMDENPYTIAAELRDGCEGTIREAALKAMKGLTDFRELPGSNSFNYYKSATGGRKYSPLIRDAIMEHSERLWHAEDEESRLKILEHFYKYYGVGKLGLHKAFRVLDGGEVEPILNVAECSLDDLVGYERQKKMLCDNTEAFLAGRSANNVLLYGEAGTGKSSSIRGILHKYYEKGLRMIEVYKHQYREINELIRKIKDRNYRFIIYLDDLSFEEFEVEYKYLKAVIEGGLEARPENVLIYATSNRRHLVRESFNDRPESPLDKHRNETVQEKLSLFARFGVSIYYGAPEPKEYYNIVEKLAERYKLPYSKDELKLLANQWELNHNGLSGRTAAQLIDDLRGKTEGSKDGRKEK